MANILRNRLFYSGREFDSSATTVQRLANVNANTIKDINYRYSKVLVTLAFGYFVFRFLGPVGIAIVDGIGGFAIQAAIVLLCYCMSVKSILRAFDVLVTLGFVFVNIVAVTFLDNGLGSFLNNTSAALYLLFLFTFVFDKDIKKYYCKLMSLFLIVFTATMFVIGKSGGYFGIYNANTVGVITVICVVTLNCFMRDSAILFILNVISFFMILYSDSRTALIVYVTSLMMLIIFAKRDMPKLYKFLFWLFVVMGILLPFFYVYMFNNQNLSWITTLQNFSIEYFDKNIFTGREMIWGAAIDQFSLSLQNVLFGIGSHYGIELSIDNGNFHNAFFSILITSGAIGTALFFVLLYSSFVKVLKVGTLTSRRACLGFLALLVLGFSESVLFSGYTGLAIFLVLALGLEKTDSISSIAHD